jgi:hypothetical protein
MDVFTWVLFLLCGAAFCWGLFEYLRAWLQKRLDREYDRGFRAGRNPEAGGWVYLLPDDEIVTQTETLPPEPEKAPGHFVPLYR